MLELEPWLKRWTVDGWHEYLNAGESQTGLATLRQCTHTGRPAGTPEFISALEQSTVRLLAPRKGGRSKKPATNSRQHRLEFIA